MKSIRKYIEQKKEQYRLQAEEQLKSGFKIVEKGGSLWLTHQGIAFMKVSVLAYANDIARELNKARECAIEFEKL